MNKDTWQMLILIYQTLRLHQETTSETFYAANALVRAVTESDAGVARLYHRYHDELIRENVKKESELIGQLDEIIRRLKTASEEIAGNS